jgi:hypothetical protein
MEQQMVFATPLPSRMYIAIIKECARDSQQGNEKRFYENVKFLHEDNVDGECKKRYPGKDSVCPMKKGRFYGIRPKEDGQE